MKISLGLKVVHDFIYLVLLHAVRQRLADQRLRCLGRVRHAYLDQLGCELYVELLRELGHYLNLIRLPSLNFNCLLNRLWRGYDLGCLTFCGASIILVNVGLRVYRYRRWNHILSFN